jgi:hypothetical protein
MIGVGYSGAQGFLLALGVFTPRLTNALERPSLL